MSKPGDRLKNYQYFRLIYDKTAYRAVIAIFSFLN